MVQVVGDFNQWQGECHSMHRTESGIWTAFIPGMGEGDRYKYRIITQWGEELLKADPFGFYGEVRPKSASRVFSLEGYRWKDQSWQEEKREFYNFDRPVFIYEVHLGSWMRQENGAFLSYREVADRLVDYVADMGFTHIELMPVQEHPFDGSWGYQLTGFYAPTSRYGNPFDLMYLIDRCHQRGIGVILDWVPGHFCRDGHGLMKFDGTALYEHENPQKSENRQWGTLNFDFGKPEVWSFLISNAVYWLEVYHIDGLRVDAVANMLYLDYGREGNDWIPNIYGGRENLEAAAFLKKLNEVVFHYFPGAMMIAEESTAWPLVTRPTYTGGLGFSHKWNMGWMNDMLRYLEMGSVHRKWHHNLVTFSLMYAFAENFILPLSHDEVVHEKKSLLDKMPGDYWQKFANLRLFYGYLMTHPGKKLLFMGGEFGQFNEWRDYCSLDWHLLDYPMHYRLQQYVRSLAFFYRGEKALWEQDFHWQGFQWIDHQDNQQSIITFMRRGKSGEDVLLVACNFTPVVHENYRIGVPELAGYREVFNSDGEACGGSGQGNPYLLMAEGMPWHNQPFSLELTLPPLAIIILKQCTSYKNSSR
jgi:1,4-alpha-glucan branching enzyme